MTCNVCGKGIEDGAPMIGLSVELCGWVNASRFTGIVWHPGCAPIEREHLVEEARVLRERLGVKG